MLVVFQIFQIKYEDEVNMLKKFSDLQDQINFLVNNFVEKMIQVQAGHHSIKTRLVSYETLSQNTLRYLLTSFLLFFFNPISCYRESRMFIA